MKPVGQNVSPYERPTFSIRIRNNILYVSHIARTASQCPTLQDSCTSWGKNRKIDDKILQEYIAKETDLINEWKAKVLKDGEDFNTVLSDNVKYYLSRD